jgi:hypothetical protein
MRFEPASVQVPDYPVPLDGSLSRYSAFVEMAQTARGLAFEAAVAAQDHAVDQIVKTPAATLAEALAKARILLDRRIADGDLDERHPSDRMDFEMLASIVADLERLADAGRTEQ